MGYQTVFKLKAIQDCASQVDAHDVEEFGSALKLELESFEIALHLAYFIAFLNRVPMVFFSAVTASLSVLLPTILPLSSRTDFLTALRSLRATVKVFKSYISPLIQWYRSVNGLRRF